MNMAAVLYVVLCYAADKLQPEHHGLDMVIQKKTIAALNEL